MKYEVQKNKKRKYSELQTSEFRFQKGFTMMEMIAAIFLIAVGAIGLFSLVSQTTSLVSVSSSRLKAIYLAQEGIEIAKNIRDTNFLRIHNGEEGASWDDNLTGGEHYNFDYRSQSVPDNSNCNGRDYLKPDGNFYTCSFDTTSPFQRKITITPDTDTLEISVQVSWQERGRAHQVTAKENLYNWY